MYSYFCVTRILRRFRSISRNIT